MSEPVDLLTATQDAVFAALNVPAVTALAPVYQHVPENAEPPMIVVGDITAEPFGAKDGGLEQHTFEIEYRYRGMGRRGLLALMHAGRTAIAAANLVADGAGLAPAVWLSSAAIGADDGITYEGTQQFQTWAQAAD